MMKRSILCMLTALALCAALLAGCGGSSSSSQAGSAASSAPASSDQTAETRAGAENAAADLDSNQFEIAAMNIEYDFMLAADDVVSYKGVRSNDNGDAGLVLVIQPAAGRSEAICETLETYKQDQVAFYGNYPEFGQAQANVQNAVIKGSDSLVVMVIASNECDADLGPAVDAVFAQ